MVVPREDNLEISNFKGLDISSHPSLVPDNTFSILRNIEFGNQGEMMRRRGLWIYRDFHAGGGGSSPAIGTGTVTFHGTFFVDANEMYKIYTAGYVTYVQSKYGDPTGVAGLPGDFLCIGVTQFNNIWYFLSSNHGIYKVAVPSGAPTATAVTGSPNGATFLSFKDRLWVVQVNSVTSSALSSTIQFSDSANFESWDAANIAMVNVGDGDVITSLVAFSDRIIVFKKFSIWNMYLQGGDFPVSAIRLMVRGKGAVSTKATISENNIIYFISRDGIWKTDGSTFVDISGAIKSIFQHGYATYAYDQLDWISYFDQHLHLQLTAQDNYPNPGLVKHAGGYYFLTMNIATTAWSETVFSPWNTLGSVLTRPVSSREWDGTTAFYQGGAGRIWLRSEDYYKDDMAYNGGTGFGDPQAIPVTLKSKRFSVGNNTTRVKRLKYGVLGLDGSVSTPSYFYTVDGVNRDSFSFDASAVSKYGAYKIPGCGYFRTFEFNLSDSGMGPLSIDFLHFIMHLKRQLTESPR